MSSTFVTTSLPALALTTPAPKLSVSLLETVHVQVREVSCLVRRCSVDHRPPAFWNEDEEEYEDVKWEDGTYKEEDPELAEEMMSIRMRQSQIEAQGAQNVDS